MTKTPTPTALTVHQKSRVLDIAFDDGAAFSLPFEYLRVYSPSAEVRGHGAGQEVLQLGKREVGISALDPVGNYAVKPTFTDGHDTGLYTFEYLHKLGNEQAALWQDYLQRLAAAGFAGDAGREPGAAIAGAPTKAAGCGHKH
jgi:DUF971 family protein